MSNQEKKWKEFLDPMTNEEHTEFCIFNFKHSIQRANKSLEDGPELKFINDIRDIFFNDTTTEETESN